MAAAAPVSEEELAARQEEIGQSKKISHNFIRNHLFLTQPDFTHQSRWLFQPRRTTTERLQKKLLEWLAARNPDLVSADGSEILLPNLTSEVVLQYLTFRTFKRGTLALGSNTHGTVQLEISALKNLFGEKNLSINEQLEMQIDRFAKCMFEFNECLPVS